MNHFRTIILRNALISIGAILLMAGCEPEPLLDDSPSDTNEIHESDAAWSNDAWWNQDATVSTDVAPSEDKDTEVVDNSDTQEPDTDDTTEQPQADHPDFVVVADTLRDSCGAPGCHGAAAQGNFAMEDGMNATNNQVRAALEGIVAKSGEMLIEPEDPDMSEIYFRLITDDLGLRMPPPAIGGLEQDKIDLIMDWIESGAPYE